MSEPIVVSREEFSALKQVLDDEFNSPTNQAMLAKIQDKYKNCPELQPGNITSDPAE